MFKAMDEDVHSGLCSNPQGYVSVLDDKLTDVTIATGCSGGYKVARLSGCLRLNWRGRRWVVPQVGAAGLDLVTHSVG